MREDGEGGGSDREIEIEEVERWNMAIKPSFQVRADGLPAITKFMSQFYCSINLGCAIALTAVAYVHQLIGFYIGYAAAVTMMLLSFITFLSGRCFAPDNLDLPKNTQLRVCSPP